MLNKNILITGGTGAVGSQLVAVFSGQAGLDVLFTYHKNNRKAKQIAEKFSAQSIYADNSGKWIKKIDKIDILINNAAINISRESTSQVSLSAWDSTIQTNLTIPFLLTKKVLSYMKKNKWGRIINISSIYGLRGCEENLPYCVSKHGLSAMTKVVAKEYAHCGITCNEICPGPIQSNLLEKIAIHSAGKDGVDDYYRQIIAEIPTGRLAQPMDIANAVLFLAQEQASYINGVSLTVDGALIA